LTASRTQLVGIIPAAGFATRLQPLTGSKEMVEIAGRPVVDFLLERLQNVRCSEIRVTTRPEKKDLVQHAARRGARVIEAYPSSVSESLLLAVADLGDDDVVLAGFPDTIWQPPDGFARLVDTSADVALGLFGVSEGSESDRVEVDTRGVIRGIEVKPAKPRSALTWGCFSARVGTLRELRDPEPGRFFDSLKGSGRLVGVYLSDDYIDVGTPDGLAYAAAAATNIAAPEGGGRRRSRTG
jgi:NDP-sugar pyrophosphorylase family protein